MKKFLAGILTMLLFLGFAVCVEADQTDSVAVKVTILSSISVDITETEVVLASVSTGGTTASTTEVTVTNTGSGIDETYSLNLIDPTDWTASQTAPDAEVYVLNAAFNSDGTLTWDETNHALSTTSVVCTSSQFAGDQTGVSVPYNEVRKLWFQFQAPTATSVTTQQSITVTITAQVS